LPASWTTAAMVFTGGSPIGQLGYICPERH
jgi:hypothetical protein